MRSAKIAACCFFVLVIVLLIGIRVQTFHLKAKDIEYYYREKTARRGELQKAKEKKKSLSFSQQRFGVLRSLWFDEKVGLRRQFHLQATMAFLDIALKPTGTWLQETFLRPHGWLQEKISWEVLSTAEEVEQCNGKWRMLKTKKPLAEKQVEQVSPFQLLRYYDAVKAIWDIQKNTLILLQVHFTDYKKQDHGAVFDLTTARVLLKGYADEMTFRFKEGGKEEVSSKGLKIHFEKNQ